MGGLDLWHGVAVWPVLEPGIHPVGDRVDAGTGDGRASGGTLDDIWHSAR